MGVMSVYEGLEKPAERQHHFQFNTPQGVAMATVPHSQMRRCTCGCDRFQVEYHVTWGKPSGQLGAQPICMQVQIFVCAECGEEVTPASPTVGTPMEKLDAIAR